MMWGYGYGGYGWPMLWMSVWGGIWLIILGVAIWALVRWINNRSIMGGHKPSAMEILRQRYARGEIDTAAFTQMREELMASGTRDE